MVLVTIITPCYNAEKYIRKTIESVISQTFRDWEMLIIDDCSTDNSAKVIQLFSNKDSRIQYIRTPKKSGSPSVPRNIGINKAKGKYIAFLDADDVWLPFKLFEQINWMEYKQYEISYSFYEKMDCKGKRSNRIIKTRNKTTYRNLLKSNSIPCLTSVITRKAIGETRFKQIPQEDFCFWLDILKKGYQAYNICKVTALYREAQESRSANKGKMFLGYWNVIRKQQNISLISAWYYMFTYTIYGVIKYLK